MSTFSPSKFLLIAKAKVQKNISLVPEKLEFMGFSQHKNLHSVLLVFWLVYSCFIGFSTAIDTITVNQSIRDPETLISNEKKFKLGFFSPPGSSYRYLGVMYNLPVMTVVWVANRNKPLNDSTGSLGISEDGNLMILDGRQETVWSTNLTSSVANSSAVLLDTGNLVLQDKSSVTVWESFQHATDSFIEKMKILTDLSTNEKITLTSWRNPSDPSLGSFTFTIEPLEVPQIFVWKDGYPYWRSGPWNGQIFTGIPNMDSVYKRGIGLVSNSPGTAYVTFTNLNSSVLLYYVLNTSGSLQELWFNEKGKWVVTWSSTDNECDSYGKCGSFASCNAQDRPICTCLPGFVPKSNDEWEVGNWTSGCTRKTHLHCPENNNEGKEDGFLKLSRVKFPDHLKLLPTTEPDCRSQCLRNCSCTAYAYASGIGCVLWDENLVDVQMFSYGGDDLYIRVPYSELGNKKDRRAIIATMVVLGFIIIAVCAYFLPKLLLKYRGRKQKDKLIRSKTKETETGYSEESTLKHKMHGVKLEELPLFNFRMISDATGAFDPVNKLGQGGFGPVYRGNLPNGQEIAVKRLARSSNQGLEEFMNEVEVISRLQHRNLVRLLGCCVESEEKMLVYEYMPNGSLDAYLFDSHKREFLDWAARMIIIEGICRGLLYLHRDSRLRIIHRDLKASNILLDEELNPKISDFGMARIFGSKDDHANTTRVVGTYGYMSPEYALHGIFSEKSDVYSFGVLLLEIVSGKMNARFYDEDQQLFLIAYAWKLWNEAKIVNLMDPTIYDPRMENDIVRYANVGLLCVQELAADRPNILTVLSMLSREIVELPCPKQPAFLGIHRTTATESSQKNPSKCSVNDVTVTILEGR